MEFCTKNKMKNLETGKDPVTLNSLVSAIEKSATLGQDLDNWKCFVQQIETNAATRDLLDRLDGMDAMDTDILPDILSAWKADPRNENATLGSISEALLASQMKETSEFLLLHFQEHQFVLNIDEVIGGESRIKVFKGRFSEKSVAIRQIHVAANTNLAELKSLNNDLYILMTCHNFDNLMIHYCKNYLTSSSKYLLVMEFCETNLKTFVERKDDVLKMFGQVQEPPTIEVLRMVTEGLFHLHKSNIVHTDLKPANVLLKVRNGRVVAKLADFKVHKEPEERSGKLYYWIAPEIVHALTTNVRVPLDKGSNIFTLGCIFYYVLSSGNIAFRNGVPALPANYRPDLRFDDMGNNSIHYSHLRLILFMISFLPKNRPDILTIKSHPIFWPAQKRLSFLTDAFDLKNRNSQGIDQLVSIQCWIKTNYANLAGANRSNFEQIFSNVNDDGWLVSIDNSVRAALERYGQFKYNGKSLWHLLRAIRNLRAHIIKNGINIQTIVGLSPEDYLNYWHSQQRFPFLLDFVWSGLHRLRNEIPWLERYFEGVSTNFDFTEIIIYVNNGVYAYEKDLVS